MLPIFSEPRLVKILKIGLYLAPLTVFLFYPRTFFPMITLKFVVFSVLIEILAFFWLWLILFHPQYRLKKNWIAAALLILLIVITIASMLGANMHRSFWSTPDRLSGLFQIWHFFLYFLILYSLRSQINWQKYLTYIFGISAVVALFAFIQAVKPGIFLSGEASRPGSFLGNPAFLGGYLLFTIFLGLFLASRSQGKTRALFLAGVIIEAGAVLLGDTRGALTGLIIGAVILLAYKAYTTYTSYPSYTADKTYPTDPTDPTDKSYPAYRTYLFNPYAIALAVLIIFGGIFFFTRSAPLWQSIPGFDRLATISANDASVNNRLIAWNIAFKGFNDNPILGNGWENYKYTLDRYYEPALLRSGQSETFWDKPHNIFLEHLAAGGLLGLLAYLGVLAAAFYIAVKKSPPEFRPFGISLLIAYVIHSFFFFDTFGTFLMFAVLLAFLASHEDESIGIQPTSADKLRWAKAGLLGLAALAALYGVFLNTKIVYANYSEWNGYNYFINRYPLDAISNYKLAMAVRQPYQNDIRARYLQALGQAVAQMEVLGEKEEAEYAINEFRQAIIADPVNYSLYLVLTEAKLKFGRYISRQFYTASESDIQRAMIFSPNRQANLYLYAKIKYLRGNTGEAVKIMQGAVDLDPLSAEPHYYYGMLLLESGQPSLKVDAQLRRAVELGYVPKDAIEAKSLGDYFGDHENYDIALHYYNYAISNSYSPRDPDGYLKIGLVYVFMGDTESARPYLEKVLELVPDLKTSEEYASFRPYFEAAGL